MTAPTRRTDAAGLRAVASTGTRSTDPNDIWSHAAEIRRTWLGCALATEPADRDRAERAITRIYARIWRPRPRFEWVDSPAKAMPLVAGLPTLDALYDLARSHRPGPGRPPLASDLAVAVSRLRGGLSAGVGHPDPELTPARKPRSKGNGKDRDKGKDEWPELPPREALGAGVPLGVVLHRGVRNALHTSLIRGFAAPVRAALARHGDPVPVCWYGQQDAFWTGYYDTLRRLGLARYGAEDAEHFDDWITLARCAGWWWPDEDVCVVTDRPAEVHTEAVPGGWHEEVTLARVRYRDGWSLD
jgi:hypothetical protein